MDTCAPVAEEEEEPAVYCAPLLLASVRRVERMLRQRLPVTPPDRLVIDYDCDGAVGSLDHVDLELGGGHSGGLRLVRFEPDGERVLVRSLELLPYVVSRPPLLRHAELPLAKLEAALSFARVAIVARPHRVAIRHRLTSTASAVSAWISSNDFHRLLGIVDDEEYVTGGAFSGYDGSGSDTRLVPVLLATEPLVALLEPLAWHEAEPTTNDRAWFTERFLATMDRSPRWWVAERYLTLALDYADADALPALRKLVATCDRDGDVSLPRQREAAERAIAAIESR